MEITFYRGGNILVSILTEKADWTKKIMADDIITVSFDYYKSINFAIGDYIVFNQANYSINTLPEAIKTSTNKFSYTVILESLQYELSKVQYMFQGAGDFYLMGNAQTFINLLVTNMNRIQSGWSAGTVISTDYVNIYFSAQNCLDVLNKLAKQFNAEFYFNGKQINFTIFGTNNGLTFKYGLNKGLTKIDRQTVNSQNIITRLYAFGSSKNLPANYRNYSSRLKFVTAGNNYIEQNTNLYGIIEATQIFDGSNGNTEIYPHRTGTISAVNGSDVTKFTDSGMDFDLNSYLLPGVTAKVHFQTGNLGGYELEVSAYNNSTKEFTLILFNDAPNGMLPNSTVKPAIGDQYVLIDIQLPQSYIDSAEAALLSAAQVYLAQYCNPWVNYTCNSDQLYFKRNNINLNCVDYITINDSDLNINSLIRIISLTQSLVYPFNYQFELANAIFKPKNINLISNVQDHQRIISINGINNISDVLKNSPNAQILSDIIADGQFSPVEKSAKRLEWNIIANEKTTLDNQATAYGITTEKTTYDNAFQALANYLNAGTWSNGIPLWISDSQLAITNVIIPATFRSNYQTYYDARTALVNKIADKSTQVALDAGLSTTGGIQLGAGDTIKVGMAGDGTLNTSIRLWAGATFTNRASAPFQVLQSGKIIITTGNGKIIIDSISFRMEDNSGHLRVLIDRDSSHDFGLINVTDGNITSQFQANGIEIGNPLAYLMRWDGDTMDLNKPITALSFLSIFGNFISTLTTPYSIADNDFFIIQTSVGSVTLPSAASNNGRILIIKMLNQPGNVIINRSGSDLIDNATTFTLNISYSSIRLISDGVSHWYTW